MKYRWMIAAGDNIFVNRRGNGSSQTARNYQVKELLRDMTLKICCDETEPSGKDCIIKALRLITEAIWGINPYGLFHISNF